MYKRQGQSEAFSIVGGAAVDNLTGGSGADAITGAAGDDIISGGAGNDTITGGADNDSLTGGGGNDTFNIDSGTDTVNDLATGDDLVVSSGATANAINITSFVADSDTTNSGTVNRRLELQVGLSICHLLVEVHHIIS